MGVGRAPAGTRSTDHDGSARRVCLVLLVAALAACGRQPERAMVQVETAYQEARFIRDQIDVTRARGMTQSPRGVALDELVIRYRASIDRLGRELDAAPVSGLEAEDRRALEAMRHAAETVLEDEPEPSGAGDRGAGSDAIDCGDDAGALARGPGGFARLSERVYACFAQAATHLEFEGGTLDRLAVLGLLPVTDDPDRRRRLFLALSPVWTSINHDNGPDSPYRQLVRLSAERMRTARTSIEDAVTPLGVDPRAVEGWLVSILERWREMSPRGTIEPWDFAYEAGRADRALRRATRREVLREVNDRFYRDLGADPLALGIRYDLEPRDGKDPVAFTTFGERPRLREGVWTTAEPWVFAAYSAGGVGHLNELLHETGHAVHIAAIRTRPAFMDWPDSDVFTEAIADVAALEMFEPPWQARYLGVSVPLADSLRARYAGTVMDTAWALFEIRVHRDPDLDPNEVWSDITSRYLRIRPHPELSWWAVRGQLIDLPGYMLNYAAGAILVADLRARIRALHGPYTTGDPTWYEWVSERLYRFGLERPSRQVVEEFLGRPASPAAILADMTRAAPAESVPLP